MIDSQLGRTVDITGLFKVAVFNRYGLDRHALALIDGMVERMEEELGKKANAPLP